MNRRQILTILGAIILVACSKQSDKNSSSNQQRTTDEDRRASAQNAASDIKKAAKSTRDYLVVQADEFQNAISQRLSDIDARFNDWHNRNNTPNSDTTPSDLQQKRAEIQTKLDAYRDATPEQRIDLSREIDDSVNDYERLVDQARNPLISLTPSTGSTTTNSTPGASSGTSTEPAP